MLINRQVTAESLRPATDRVFELAAEKVRQIDRTWDPAEGTPVFTIEGRYSSRGWTEWTQGFQYGCAILAADALDDTELFELGRRRTMENMLPHVTHIGVHDHGFNNLSTYGNLLRLLIEGRFGGGEGHERTVYENALAASGAVQASRWAEVHVEAPHPHAAGAPALGYVYSFNGPQSLFVDTMRSMRILGVAWQHGHVLMHEHDAVADLLQRSVLHGLATSRYIVFHGESEHTYDVRGRTAHEAIFNPNDGRFRCRSTQQGYSPFSTWTRGLSWAMLGFAEELEFFKTISGRAFRQSTGLGKNEVMEVYQRCAMETCEHYLRDIAAADGVCYWDDGAPSLHKLVGWQERAADPFNEHEPVDSSAAAIAAQGLIRLGHVLGKRKGQEYLQAGLTVARSLFDAPYLSTSPEHQGLLLHSVYHHPNGWDHVPKGQAVPCGESCMWGDYHLLELALLVRRMADGGPYLTFFVQE